MQKRATWAHWEGGGGANSPLWPRYHPEWFKTSTLKENCLLNYCWGKKGKKTKISPFPATHTYIKLTLVSLFFLLFFCTFPLASSLFSSFHSMLHCNGVHQLHIATYAYAAVYAIAQTLSLHCAIFTFFTHPKATVSCTTVAMVFANFILRLTLRCQLWPQFDNLLQCTFAAIVVCFDIKYQIASNNYSTSYMIYHVLIPNIKYPVTTIQPHILCWYQISNI